MTRYAYQLYSSRNFGPLGETLTMLAGVGYDAVEGYGALLSNTETLRALEAGLDATGLAMPTAHIDLAHLKDDPAGVIAMARRFDMSGVFAPYLPPEARPVDAEGWRRIAHELDAIGKPFIEAGLTFGWHNHDFELHPLPNGEYPIDILLAASDHIHWEFDLAWAHVAGHDPAHWLDRHGTRIVAAHIKDIAPNGQKTDEDGWADVGTGIMDWPALHTRLKTLGVASLIVEHDNPSNDRRFASTSLVNLRRYDAA